MRFIHKLPFGVPRGVEAKISLCTGRNSVWFLSELKGMKKSMIAYKGNYEKRFAGQSWHTVAEFGVLWLSKSRGTNGSVDMVETCGNHSWRNAYIHCLKVEAEAFICHCMGKHSLSQVSKLFTKDVVFFGIG